MLLAIHIGNTDIAIGVHDGKEFRFCAEISTKPYRTADEYAVLIGQIFDMRGFKAAGITDVILSSVVPSLLDTLRAAIAQFTSVKPSVVGAGMKTGLKIKTDAPAQLGSDLVALACGAKLHTDGACIIAAFDTATTLTVIGTDGSVTGVIIMPGVVSAAQALERDAAQLTEISLIAPKHVIGKNTADSVRSGILWGCAAQIDGLILHIADELSCPVSDITLLAVGKYASRIIPLCTHSFCEMPHLLFEGLLALHKRNHSQ